MMDEAVRPIEGEETGDAVRLFDHQDLLRHGHPAELSRIDALGHFTRRGQDLGTGVRVGRREGTDPHRP